MATASYPKISSNSWQVLRARVAAAPSVRLNASTVATLLDMANPKSATDNVVAPLRRLGLLEEDGSLTERGHRWRVDATYAQACQEILDEVYPEDLKALTDEKDKPDKARIQTWLQHQGQGASNASQVAATYVMIAEKRLPEANGTELKKRPVKAATKAKPKKTTAALVTEPVDERTLEPAELLLPSREPVKSSPNIHLDIQIHIPATASLEQIDQIFASMAKHLYQ